MPLWILKALVQGGISFLPGNQSWNYLFQKHVTKTLNLGSGRFERKLEQCRKHVENYAAAAPAKKTSLSVLELGTGWYPVVPIGLYLCGARVWTVDRMSLLRASEVKEVLRLFLEHTQRGGLTEILPYVYEDRISSLQNLLDDDRPLPPAEMLKKLDIHHVICDARSTGLETSPIDLFVSNNTLEHIPEDVIYKIFLEFGRIASPGAVMSHFIDMKDHYANFDRSITHYNFLKYSSSWWRLFNNDLQYQNRLRISDHRRIHQAAGFKIVYEINEKGSPEELECMTISEEFRRHSNEELLVFGSWMVSTRNGEPHQGKAS